MSDRQLQELMETMDRLRAERGQTEESAREFLREEGVITQTGELTEPYR